jgi:hypothetical protein
MTHCREIPLQQTSVDMENLYFKKLKHTVTTIELLLFNVTVVAVE